MNEQDLDLLLANVRPIARAMHGKPLVPTPDFLKAGTDALASAKGQALAQGEDVMQRFALRLTAPQPVVASVVIHQLQGSYYASRITTDAEGFALLATLEKNGWVRSTLSDLEGELVRQYSLTEKGRKHLASKSDSGWLGRLFGH